MKFDIESIMREAQKMQEKMQSAQQEIEKLIVQGTAGAGAVKIKLNGRFNAMACELDEELLIKNLISGKYKKQVVEELIVAAINDAVRKIQEGVKGKVTDLTKDMNVPGDIEKLMKQLDDKSEG